MRSGPTQTCSPWKPVRVKNAVAKKIRIHIDATLEETPIFESLADDENAAEHNRRASHANHRAIVIAQAALRTPDREAAGKQADAEKAGLEQIQIVGARSGLRVSRCNREKRESARRKKPVSEMMKATTLALFFSGEVVDLSFVPTIGSGRSGLRDIPQRATAANGGQVMKIFVRRRRSGRPFQRPGAPRIVPGLAPFEADYDQDSRRTAATRRP